MALSRQGRAKKEGRHQQKVTFRQYFDSLGQYLSNQGWQNQGI
jgi:hypothetical protein